MRQRKRVYSNFRQFMTLTFPYNERMKTLSFLDNLLTPSPLIGILWLILLFILCFLGIHVAKLARIGKRHLKDDNQKPQEKSGENVSSSPQKTPKQPTSSAPSVSSPSSAEPVYYIVERKRRTKSSFSEPKQIKFK